MNVKDLIYYGMIGIYGRMGDNSKVHTKETPENVTDYLGLYPETMIKTRLNVDQFRELMKRRKEMTGKEALERLEFEKVKNELLELVDRDTPKKVRKSSHPTLNIAFCPKCREEQHTNTTKFCSECGQRLDWSE